MGVFLVTTFDKHGIESKPGEAQQAEQSCQQRIKYFKMGSARKENAATIAKKQEKKMIEKFEKDAGGIKGLHVIKPKIFGDSRGYFAETYNKRDFDEAMGAEVDFVQDNQSSSSKGVLRGLHFQIRHPQDKLVRVLQGAVYDVAVDMREGSPTFGRHYGVTLTGENHLQFFVPKGFAHGFLVLSDKAVFSYKVTDFYHPNDEGGLMWDDPDIGVEWPLDEHGIKEVLLSEKDRKNLSIAEYKRTMACVRWENS